MVSINKTTLYHATLLILLTTLLGCTAIISNNQKQIDLNVTLKNKSNGLINGSKQLTIKLVNRPLSTLSEEQILNHTITSGNLNVVFGNNAIPPITTSLLLQSHSHIEIVIDNTSYFIPYPPKLTVTANLRNPISQQPYNGLYDIQLSLVSENTTILFSKSADSVRFVNGQMTHIISAETVPELQYSHFHLSSANFIITINNTVHISTYNPTVFENEL